jgi:hypothetical protein
MINIPVDDEERIDPHDKERLILAKAAQILMVYAASDGFDYEAHRTTIDRIVRDAIALANDVK